MSDNYETDKWIGDLFKEYYDPCPFNPIYTDGIDIDGLKCDWFLKCLEHNAKGIFINPPYSNPLPWVQKAIKHKKKYKGDNVVMLLKNDSSTFWYRELNEHGSHFLFPYGRLKYKTGKSAPFSSVLVIL